jgi:hypothetical protein
MVLSDTHSNQVLQLEDRPVLHVIQIQGDRGSR